MTVLKVNKVSLRVSLCCRDVNKSELKPPGRCALLQVLRAMISPVTGEE